MYTFDLTVNVFRNKKKEYDKIGMQMDKIYRKDNNGNKNFRRLKYNEWNVEVLL